MNGIIIIIIIIIISLLKKQLTNRSSKTQNTVEKMSEQSCTHINHGLDSQE